ncbi:hypothetical protein OF83DRAFT_743 [Amylostereum chailletii]|nr:hypothetical protein OF83DRAFT_743 [Amylostereum chailletii]
MQMVRKTAQHTQDRESGLMARKTTTAAPTNRHGLPAHTPDGAPRQHIPAIRHPQPDDRRMAAKKHRAIQSSSELKKRVSRKSTTTGNKNTVSRVGSSHRHAIRCYPPGELYQQPSHSSWKIWEPATRGCVIPIVPTRAIRKHAFEDKRLAIRAGKRRISTYMAAKKHDPRRARPQAMQASNIIDLSSGSEQDGDPKYDDSLNARPTSPALELSEAMEALAISIPIEQSTRRAYLRRNVRRGFLGMCRALNVSCEASIPPGNVVYVVSIFDPESEEEIVIEQSYVSQQNSWRCPLCDTLGDLCPVNREMLEFHLWKDHFDVKHEWKTKKIREVDESVWTVTLRIPDILEEEEGEEEWRSPTPAPPIPDGVDDGFQHALEELDYRMETEEATPILDLTFKFASQMKLTTSLVDAAPEPAVLSPKRELEDVDLIPPLPRQAPDPDEYKRPTARYPYLPARASDGTFVQYSCRPGGPKLYDLLDTLPTEDLGLLTWDIHDRETVLFQLDNIMDEDKVMHALWNRWIHSNRIKFLVDYPAAINDFVASNYIIIHQAAGWAALRGWLLVMLTNKFLTLKEVACVLKDYGERVGIKEG